MARIPEEELARLKREVAVAALVREAGVRLSPKGKDLVGLCPFHDDKDPSLVVSPEKNLWNCLGACGEGGSVVDWVMKSSGMSFRQAVEMLRERVGAVLTGQEAGPEIREKSEEEVDVEAWQVVDEEDLLGRVVDSYHACLKESPEALAYLESRGLGSSELIDRFRLGYANRSLGTRLPARQLKAGKVIRNKLQEVGILRRSGHEHLAGSLVVPVFDGSPDRGGQVVELYGRKITPGLRPGTPLHLYLPGPHRGVWNHEALAQSKEITLCESLIDALTFWHHGFRHVTCAYGVNGFTEEMRLAFGGHGVERVLIAFDRDEAGEKGATKVAQRLLALGMECYRVLFPKGMDANEYALKVQPAAESLGLALRKARWMGKGPAPELPEAVKEEKASSSLAASEPASPVPLPPVEVPAQVREHEVVISLGDRLYRVRGLARNLSYEVLKINLLASRGEAFHVDSLDLYAARQRAAY